MTSRTVPTIHKCELCKRVIDPDNHLFVRDVNKKDYPKNPYEYYYCDSVCMEDDWS